MSSWLPFLDYMVSKLDFTTAHYRNLDKAKFISAKTAD